MLWWRRGTLQGKQKAVCWVPFCRFVRSNDCTLQSVFLTYKWNGGGTTFVRHALSHVRIAGASKKIGFSWELAVSNNMIFCDFASSACAYNLLSFNFVDSTLNMTAFAVSVFSAGHATPSGDNIDAQQLLPLLVPFEMEYPNAARKRKSLEKILEKNVLGMGIGATYDCVTM